MSIRMASLHILNNEANGSRLSRLLINKGAQALKRSRSNLATELNKQKNILKENVSVPGL